MKTIRKRKAYVKQINENHFNVCLEYGQKNFNILDRGEIIDVTLKKFSNLDEAIVYKNEFNSKT